ncbi:hypothetical protein E2C01_100662 [Portunus trituberculatus]|uniref:Uncharacterized protein n=1 Tax=Portunus trituberculatus TaxID=210409 RepID=A0A5B7KI54_PORTR|nr:hypothetical protein [Portunus trituberculatus]
MYKTSDSTHLFVWHAGKPLSCINMKRVFPRYGCRYGCNFSFLSRITKWRRNTVYVYEQYMYSTLYT